MQNVLDRVTANPKFHEFVAMRSRYSIIMAIISAAAYYGSPMMNLVYIRSDDPQAICNDVSRTQADISGGRRRQRVKVLVQVDLVVDLEPVARKAHVIKTGILKQPYNIDLAVR